MTHKPLHWIFALALAASVGQSPPRAFAGVPIVDGEQAFLARYGILPSKYSLFAALHDPDFEVRGFAASKLAAMGQNDALPFIMALAANETSPPRRLILLYPAAQLGSEEAVATLEGMCHDAGLGPSFRISAASVMLFLARENCLDDVVDVLRTHFGPHSGEGQVALLGALTLLPTFRHFSPADLAEIRRLTSPLLKSERMMVRVYASGLLGKLGDASSAEDLRTSLAGETDETARKAMTSALASLQRK